MSFVGVKTVLFCGACFCRGVIQPVHNAGSKPGPLIHCHTAEGHSKAVLCVKATKDLLFSSSKGEFMCLTDRAAAIAKERDLDISRVVFCSVEKQSQILRFTILRKSPLVRVCSTDSVTAKIEACDFFDDDTWSKSSRKMSIRLFATVQCYRSAKTGVFSIVFYNKPNMAFCFMLDAGNTQLNTICSFTPKTHV